MSDLPHGAFERITLCGKPVALMTPEEFLGTPARALGIAPRCERCGDECAITTSQVSDVKVMRGLDGLVGHSVTGLLTNVVDLRCRCTELRLQTGKDPVRIRLTHGSEYHGFFPR